MTTLLPSMTNTIVCVEEWDIKIKAVKKQVGSVILVTQTLLKRNEIKFLIFKLNIYVISFCVKKTK